MTARQNLRHAAILFDIDETLINFKVSNDLHIVWNASVDLWREYLKLLRDSAESQNMRLHFGIATFKPEFLNPFHTQKNMRGDLCSAAVLEDEKFILNNPKTIGLQINRGLKCFIDPELIFFTNGKSKTEFALALAKTHMEKTYADELVNRETFLDLRVCEDGEVRIDLEILGKMDRKDILLCDDMRMACEDAERKGYSAIWVSNLSKLELASQYARIAKIFRAIFEKLRLPIPEKILTDADAVKNEVLREEIPQKTAIVQAPYMGPRLLIPRLEELKKEGIRGLHEDEMDEEQADTETDDEDEIKQPSISTHRYAFYKPGEEFEALIMELDMPTPPPSPGHS